VVGEAVGESQRERGTVRIYYVHPDGVPAGAADLLSRTEAERCDRLPPARQPVYRAGRAALWTLLGALSGKGRAELVLDRSCRHCGDSRHGKPRLVDPGLLRGSDFSIAYSTRLAVIALCSTGEVGVDCEDGAVPDRLPATGSARWYFSPLEIAKLESLAPRERRVALWRAWVRKEALAKACGWGLFLPLRRVAGLDPVAGEQLPFDRWTVSDLVGPSGLIGAVAYSEKEASVQVERWRWGGD